MLGALRDEVVPELLGGRPAEPEAPVEPAVPDAAPDAVPDTGDVTTVEAPPVLEQPSVDDVCAAAVDLAREAAVLEGGRSVGEHVGVDAEDALTVTHRFATTDRAYVGWHWAVTVARSDGSDVVTVDEVVLLPGTGALLAPAWVPYSDRVEPGDLGAADLLPPDADDVRLVPAYADPEALLAEEAFWELGLGRPRVLSLDGRADAAERWEDGDTGPRSPRALAAPGNCADCGFLVLLAGGLRQGFGVCANGSAPDDGRVVALGHGCGAHSETPLESTRPPAAELVVDEVEFEFEERPVGQTGTEPSPATDPLPEPLPDPLPDPPEEEQAEELGHS